MATPEQYRSVFEQLLKVAKADGVDFYIDIDESEGDSVATPNFYSASLGQSDIDPELWSTN